MSPRVQTTKARASGVWKVTCRTKEGKIRWVEEIPNLVVNTGLDKILTDTFKSSGYTAAWYIGLKGSGTPVAGDTMASHGSWTENTSYDESVRQTFTPGTVASQAVSNSASPAVFTMSGAFSVYGAFLTTSNTKGGTAGTLYSAGDFDTVRSGGDGDTLTVEYTASMAAA